MGYSNCITARRINKSDEERVVYTSREDAEERLKEIKSAGYQGAEIHLDTIGGTYRIVFYQ